MIFSAGWRKNINKTMSILPFVKVERAAGDRPLQALSEDLFLHHTSPPPISKELFIVSEVRGLNDGSELI